MYRGGLSTKSGLAIIAISILLGWWCSTPEGINEEITYRFRVWTARRVRLCRFNAAWFAFSARFCGDVNSLSWDAGRVAGR